MHRHPVREKQEIEKIDPETGETVIGEDGQPETEVVERGHSKIPGTTVFDVSQTEGEPIAELEVSELTGSVQFYDIFMEALQMVHRTNPHDGNRRGSKRLLSSDRKIYCD